MIAKKSINFQQMVFDNQRNYLLEGLIKNKQKARYLKSKGFLFIKPVLVIEKQEFVS